MREDKLNFHDITLFVLRKDGHYDIVYKPANHEKWEEYETFDIFYSPPQSRVLNAS